MSFPSAEMAFWVHDMETIRSEVTAVSVVWRIAATSVAVFGLGLGWL